MNESYSKQPMIDQISSGDFDAYWEFHEQEEARRNHASNYADGKVPPVEMPKRKAHLCLVGGVV